MRLSSCHPCCWHAFAAAPRLLQCRLLQAAGLLRQRPTGPPRLLHQGTSIWRSLPHLLQAALMPLHARWRRKVRRSACCCQQHPGRMRAPADTDFAAAAAPWLQASATLTSRRLAAAQQRHKSPAARSLQVRAFCGCCCCHGSAPAAPAPVPLWRRSLPCCLPACSPPSLLALFFGLLPSCAHHLRCAGRPPA